MSVQDVCVWNRFNRMILEEVQSYVRYINMYIGRDTFLSIGCMVMEVQSEEEYKELFGLLTLLWLGRGSDSHKESVSDPSYQQMAVMH